MHYPTPLEQCSLVRREDLQTAGHLFFRQFPFTAARLKSCCLVFIFILSTLLIACPLCGQALSANKTLQPAPAFTPPVIQSPTIKTPASKTPRRLQPVSTAPKIIIQQGFCCNNGAITRTTQGICRKRRGLFFGSKRAAERQCAQNPPVIKSPTIKTPANKTSRRLQPVSTAPEIIIQQGFCCNDGAINRSTKDVCRKRRGLFFGSERAAERQCRGYCNQNGRTQRMTQTQCRKKKGDYFTSSLLARKHRITHKQQRRNVSNKKLPLSKKTLNTNPITSPDPAFMLPTDDGCREYAKKAVALTEIADRSYCNFRGDRWSNDPDKHFNWCMSVSPAKRLQEANQRLADYQKCNDCGIYAQEALWQFAQVEKNMCNLSGNGWHNDRDLHFNWCMNASPDDRINESNNRKKALETCGEIKLFAHPRYMNMVLDFCMYRRTETYSSTFIEGELYDYDFGWDCGKQNVADSYCISKGYSKAVDFKVSAGPSSVDTIPIGNTHICDAVITKANCRGFDHILCRKWNDTTSEVPHQVTTLQARNTSLKIKEIQHQKSETVASQEAVCRQYAQASVEQFHRANASWCTVGKVFEPRRWHGNIDEHYNWCLSASPEQRLNESARRNDMLQECEKWQRTFFDKPTLCGLRVDIYLNSRAGSQLESNVPQRAADAFCRRQGYEKAVEEWSLYNTSYKPEHVEKTIHLGDDDNNSNCNLKEISALRGCNIYPGIRDDCTAFNHILCEKPVSP